MIKVDAEEYQQMKRNQMDLLLEGYLYWQANGASRASDKYECWKLHIVLFEGIFLIVDIFLYSSRCL